MDNIFLNESPFIFLDDNPYTTELTDNWQIIRDQLYHYMEKSSLFTKPASRTHFSDTLYTGNFSSFGFMLRKTLLDSNEKTLLNWQPNEEIRWIEDSIVNQPFLGNWTKKHQEILGTVTGNISYPTSVLNCHWGLDENYIRFHLCLTADPGCVFNIEGWKKSWEEGEIFGFDDANVLHGTTHSGTHPRIIILIDIKKDAIREYCKNWPCRPARPAREHWPLILEKYNS